MAADQPTVEVPSVTADMITIALTHQSTTHNLSFSRDATITDLSLRVEADLSIPTSNQKYLVPKLGLLKPPFRDASLPLASVSDASNGKPIKLMGTTATEVASLASASEAASKREAAYAAQRRAQPRAILTGSGRGSSARRPRNAQEAAEESTYTFQQVRPLAALPGPERSLAFLERLKADPGIRATMRRHKFSVGLLTEMEPLSNTQSTHEGTTRLLGLNRNRGEVIELRLRTDAYDGYRSYRVIRDTLCHELAHNVHGPHDRNFWDLCHQIEREVAAADWTKSGRTAGGEEYYEPPPSEEVAYDHGGWTGGEFVLGGRGNGGEGGSGSGSGSGHGHGPDSGSVALSRREIIAKAAEERLKRIADEKQRRSGQGGDPA